MHTHLQGLEDRIRYDESLKSILRNPPGTRDDVGAGLVVATYFPRRARLPLGEDLVFNASRPKRRTNVAAANHLAERAYSETLLLTLGRAKNVFDRRPSCATRTGVELLGWIAANDPENEAQRYDLFGTSASEDARGLVKELYEHDALHPFTIRIGEARYADQERAYTFVESDFA